jgi:hypothetical protein
VADWRVEAVGEIRDDIRAVGEKQAGRRRAVVAAVGRPIDSRAEDGDQPAREERAKNLSVLVADRLHGYSLEARFLPKNRRVQLLERPAGLDAELVDQRRARVVIDAKRFRLPA